MLASKPRILAKVGAVCAYVGAGRAAFQIALAVTGDTGTANWAAALGSLPLAVPLYYALTWIDRHFG